jgi:acyl-CoA thioester hydrolase
MASPAATGPVPRAQFTFFHRLRVRWAEVDPQAIVFNPNYFVFADVAFTEYMRAIGFAYPAALEAAGTDLFAVSASANFRASALYDDELDVAVRAGRLGRSSVRFDVNIYRGPDLLVDIALTYVNAGRASKRSEPLPAELTTRILAYETALRQAQGDMTLRQAQGDTTDPSR